MQNPSNIAITGLGPVSAVGCDLDSFWKSLMAGQHGFGLIDRCDVSGFDSKIGAQIDDFSLANFLRRGRGLSRRLPRCTQLAMAAAALALQDARMDVDPERIGLLVGTSVGNLEETLVAARADLADGTNPDSGTEGLYLFNHSAACMISTEFDLRGPILTLSNGCNSTVDALGVASLLLASDQVDAVLVVGADSELFPEILRAMHVAGALATRFNNEPGRASRPFDCERDGNVIGEGAGALVLERYDLAERRGARIWSRLVAQQVRATGGSRRSRVGSPERSLDPCVAGIQKTLQWAGWAPEDVDVVNANGSSSVVYDALEARSLQRLFQTQGNPPAIHSVKSMLGQHGAGSSALQLISACLGLSHGAIPPTINHDHPDPACEGLQIVTRAEQRRIRNTLVHAIGFGGLYYSSAALSAA